MCLVKKFKIPRFTLKPKKVYKVVEKRDWLAPTVYKTPFMWKEIQMGKSYKGKGFSKYLKAFLPNQNIIEGGYIHCFSHTAGIKDYFPNFSNSSHLFIAVCEIPAYTIYWEGKECFTLAARRLKYIRIIS